MKPKTIVDTIEIQINYDEYKQRNAIRDSLIQIIEFKNIPVKKKEYPTDSYTQYYKKEYLAYYDNSEIVSLSQGSFCSTHKDGTQTPTTYYLKVKFAGLKSYRSKRDIAINELVLKIFAFLNTQQCPYKITQLDVAIDVYTKFDNVLALCTKKAPKTTYYKANEKQLYDSTTYLEKIDKSKRKSVAIRSYLYDKKKKENLHITANITRFEISFKSSGIDTNKVAETFSNYHLMKLPNKRVKKKFVDMYDSVVVMRKEDIKKLPFNLYRVHLSNSDLYEMCTMLFSINDKKLKLMNESMRTPYLLNK